MPVEFVFGPFSMLQKSRPMPRTHVARSQRARLVFCFSASTLHSAARLALAAPPTCAAGVAPLPGRVLGLGREQGLHSGSRAQWELSPVLMQHRTGPRARSIDPPPSCRNCIVDLLPRPWFIA